jgi:hypothetical protein
MTDMSFLPTPAAQPLDDDGTVTYLGHRFRRACERFDSIDKRWVDMPDDSPQKFEIGELAFAARDEMRRLLFVPFTRRTETVADAAVMAAHAFLVISKGIEPVTEAVELVQLALANIVLTLAHAASLEYNQFGEPDMVPRIRRVLRAKRPALAGGTKVLEGVA